MFIPLYIIKVKIWYVFFGTKHSETPIPLYGIGVFLY